MITITNRNGAIKEMYLELLKCRDENNDFKLDSNMVELFKWMLEYMGVSDFEGLECHNHQIVSYDSFYINWIMDYFYSTIFNQSKYADDGAWSPCGFCYNLKSCRNKNVNEFSLWHCSGYEFIENNEIAKLIDRVCKLNNYQQFQIF